jgi:thymidylate synthase (FAD)
VSRDFVTIVEEIRKGYRKLEEHFPWDKMNFEEKKRVTSALRRILPEGLATNVIWTANHRTIRWAIEARTDPSAEIEIRKVFDSVAQICTRDYPLLYGDFTRKTLGDHTSQYKPEFSKV